MKKVLTAATLFLALTLCLTVALAGGGSAGDPLVSLSYLEGVFSPSAQSQTQQKLDHAAASTREEADRLLSGMKADILAASGMNSALSPQEATLNSGDSLSGATGLTVLPLAGEIRLTLTKGDVVDATTGTEVPSGTVLAALLALSDKSLQHPFETLAIRLPEGSKKSLLLFLSDNLPEPSAEQEEEKLPDFPVGNDEGHPLSPIPKRRLTSLLRVPCHAACLVEQMPDIIGPAIGRIVARPAPEILDDCLACQKLCCIVSHPDMPLQWQSFGKLGEPVLPKASGKG